MITLKKPDDWHIHLREGDALKRTVSDIARLVGRAIVMPNLRTPLTSAQQVEDYYQSIQALNPDAAQFTPLMTLYLTDNTTVDEIEAAASNPHILAAKLYPAGATTHSKAGVRDIQGMSAVFEAMSRTGLKLLVHGEVVDDEVDIFDREAVFIERHLQNIVEAHPALKIVLEHISTKEAVEYVLSAPQTVAATITAHHLLLNRNDLLVGGVRPHHYCLPIVKRATHQRALIEQAVSGHSRFFFGSDSAPHAIGDKTSSCGCAGIYTAPVMFCALAALFEAENALDKLEPFVSHFGADFYALERNTSEMTLRKESWQVPLTLPFGATEVVPFCAGKTLTWKVDDQKA